MNMTTIYIFTILIFLFPFIYFFSERNKEHNPFKSFTLKPKKKKKVNFHDFGIDKSKIQDNKETTLKKLNNELKRKGLVEISPIVNGQDFKLDLGRNLDVLIASEVIDYQTESNSSVSPEIALLGLDGEIYDYRLEGTTYIVNDVRMYDDLKAEYEGY